MSQYNDTTHETARSWSSRMSYLRVRVGEFLTEKFNWINILSDNPSGLASTTSLTA